MEGHEEGIHKGEWNEAGYNDEESVERKREEDKWQDVGGGWKVMKEGAKINT